jgi:hypothetical protein
MGDLPTQGCVLLVALEVAADEPVRFVSDSLVFVETATNEVICAAQGDGSIVDADCDGAPETEGDGLVFVRAVNNSTIAGSVANVFGQQGNIGVPMTVDVIGGNRDADSDGIADLVDNCPFTTDALAINSDSAVAVITQTVSDVTKPFPDEQGDICDEDDDNDGFLDRFEDDLGPGGSLHLRCESATADPDTTKLDTDGDGVHDGAECALGSDPINPASVPAPPASDVDEDGLEDNFEDGMEFNAIDPDSDDDGVGDGVEFKGYNTSPLHADTDGDGCSDGVEIASVDGNTVVNIIDLQIVVSGSLQPTPPPLLDVNRDGEHNSLDLLIVATNFTSNLC